jgi:uncharacterized protein (TIGR03437 family)
MDRRLFIAVLFAIALPSFGLSQLRAQTAGAPYFTAAGVVHGATQLGGTLAPNAIATIYGSNLSWTTRAVSSSDLNGGTLPTSLDGVSVYVQGILANLLYISPGQINFIIPYELTLSTVGIIVARQGLAGPVGANGAASVQIHLATTSPGFFEWNGNFAIAEHADGSLITDSDPAQPDEIIVLYAAGLGRTTPDLTPGAIAARATSILYESQMNILLNGVPCPQTDIYYAGAAPGFAGLYQINVRLPSVLPPNPQIQIAIGLSESPAGVLLYAN